MCLGTVQAASWSLLGTACGQCPRPATAVAAAAPLLRNVLLAPEGGVP